MVNVYSFVGLLYFAFLHLFTLVFNENVAIFNYYVLINVLHDCLMYICKCHVHDVFSTRTD